MGRITSPPSMPAALTIAIKAAWPLLNTRVGTPTYASSWRSNSTTHGPLLVTCPDWRAEANFAWNDSIGGNIGLTMFRGFEKTGLSLEYDLLSMSARSALSLGCKSDARFLESGSVGGTSFPRHRCDFVVELSYVITDCCATEG